MTRQREGRGVAVRGGGRDLPQVGVLEGATGEAGANVIKGTDFGVRQAWFDFGLCHCLHL